MARLVEKELGKSISQSYLSQIESGARPHLTNSTRMLLARFFKVHPGYLVDDPEGFQNELISDLGALEDKLDLWLVSGAERFRRDPDLHHALLDGGAPRGFADVPGPAGHHSRESGAGRAADGSAASPPRPPAKANEEAFMTWSDFYLICFLVGFGLSALALLAGSVHLHLPHLHLHHGIHVPHATSAGGRRAELSWFNFGTVAAFLAWFGGTGYLLEHYYGVWFVVALGVAIAERAWRGVGGVLVPRQGADGARSALDPADYDMVGVLGRVTASRSAPAAPAR